MVTTKKNSSKWLAISSGVLFKPTYHTTQMLGMKMSLSDVVHFLSTKVSPASAT
tara:strand:+ start:1729 stop:1890 length:162 start_codon:yes stop_codon:yes gene_type:complete